MHGPASSRSGGRLTDPHVLSIDACDKICGCRYQRNNVEDAPSISPIRIVQGLVTIVKATSITLLFGVGGTQVLVASASGEPVFGDTSLRHK